MKLLLLSVFLILMLSLSAQQGDFIVIRKNGTTFKTFFTGAYVTFMANSGEWMDGKVLDIRNDSIFFRQLIIRQVPTPWGVPRLDTMSSYIKKFWYGDIVAIPKKRESFSYIKNGTVFMIGGGGYMLLNVVNSAYLHYSVFGKKNRPGLLTAAGFFGAGYLLKKLHKNFIPIGKKYSVEYIRI